jgi:hypothetical protein
VNQRSTAAIAVSRQQTLRLPHAHIQQCRSRLSGSSPRQYFGEYLNPLQVPLAHLHPAQSVASQPQNKEISSDTLALQNYDIFALRLQQFSAEGQLSDRIDESEPLASGTTARRPR